MHSNRSNREVWSFFSGAMGLDLGLEQVGIQTTLAVELDKWCCKTIKQNRPDIQLVERGDVTRLTGARLRQIRQHDGDVYLMVGGPPCQSFSPGGKRAALSDPRGNLIYEYLRLIREVQPQFFVLENVANLVTAALRHRPIKERPGKKWNLSAYGGSKAPREPGVAAMEEDELSGSAIRQLLVDIQSLGYNVVFGVVNAAEVGAPQKRLRFLMHGMRDGTPPPLPRSTHGDHIPRRSQFMTLRDAIFDLRTDPGPSSEYTEEMARFFRLVPEGGNWRDLPQDLQRAALGGAYESGGGKTGFFRRLAWDAPAPTITGKANRKGSAICHPEATRPLSVRECARVQGFPDDWVFAGAMSQQYLQIGNAVPVHLGRAVGESFAQYSDSISQVEATQTSTDLEMMLQQAIRRLRAAASNKRTTHRAATADLFTGEALLEYSLTHDA